MTHDWSRRRVAGVLLLVIIAFLWRPLFGAGVLLPNDFLNSAAPWAAERTGAPVENPWLSDTLAVHSQFASLGDAFRNGEASFWDRSLVGGLPTLKAGFSPLMVPYLVVPASYAPGLVAALRLLTAAGLMFGFLRRGLQTDRSAALIGAVAYAFTGYLVAWAAWPQSNVAAFAPGILWAAEALLRDPRPRRAVPIAAGVAAILLSNFPLAAAYVLLAAGIYVLWRSLSVRGLALVARFRTLRGPVLWGGVGVVLGVALVALYLSEFTAYFDFNDTSARDKIPADSSTGTRFLLTLVLPWAYGAAHQEPFFWAPGTNWIEAQGYVGFSVLILALMALAVPRTRGELDHRASAARALWALAVLGLWISYVGGPLTEAIQSLPLLGANSVGRSRVISHLAFAALAGLGAQALLDRDRHPRVVDLRRATRRAGLTLLGAGLIFGPWLLDWGREARARGVAADAATQSVLPIIAGLATAGLILAVARDLARPSKVIAPIAALVLIELWGFGYSVSTVVDTTVGGYETQSHLIVRESLEPGERMAGDARTFFPNTNQVTEIDDARGQLLYQEGWRAALNGVQPGAFGPPGTATNPWFGHEAELGDPVLDAMAVALWAEESQNPVRGVHTDPPASTGISDASEGGLTATVDVPLGGIRGVILDVSYRASDDGRLVVQVVSGQHTLETQRPLASLPVTGRVDVALAGQDLPEGPATVNVWATGMIEIATIGEGPALGLVTPADDGLRLVGAGPVTLYERANAAAAWFVPGLQPDQLDLQLHGPAAMGSIAADIREIRDGRVRIDLAAPTAGTLVISQFAFPGWTARVDGERVTLHEVDNLITGVAIEPGTHSVNLDYKPRHLSLWMALAALAMVILGALWWWDQPRKSDAALPGSVA